MTLMLLTTLILIKYVLLLYNFTGGNYLIVFPPWNNKFHTYTHLDKFDYF